GIRDFHVTGVQTCALPIWAGRGQYPVEAFVIVDMGHGVDLLLIVCNSDGDDRLEGAQARQGAVVEAAAVAQPVALGVEGEQWARSEERRVGKEGRAEWSRA